MSSRKRGAASQKPLLDFTDRSYFYPFAITLTVYDGAMINKREVIPMNFMILSHDTESNHKRKGYIMAIKTYNDHENTESAELMKLLREKRRERRRRQINAFYESLDAQNADKLILLFDNGMNIA